MNADNGCRACHRGHVNAWYAKTKMPHADFNRAVRELAARYGVLCSPVSTRGFPIVLIGSKVLYRTLKVGKQMPGPTERQFVRALLAAGGNWALWRPDCWDLIEEEIQAIGQTVKGQIQ